MSRSIQEIMNRELLSVEPETPVTMVRELLRTFSVSAVPVVNSERRPIGMVEARALFDAGGTAGDRMSRPAICVEGSTGIEVAAHRLALANAHHLVVVDTAGVAVGIVALLDLLRAMLNIPANHPVAFPHWSAETQSSWTDDWPLDEEHASKAPEAAGVVILVRGSLGETDAIVWAEACTSLRDRIRALTGPVKSEDPALESILQGHDLRFRVSSVSSDIDRERIVAGLRGAIEHRPPPRAT
jgi:hypothetical protein